MFERYTLSHGRDGRILFTMAAFDGDTFVILSIVQIGQALRHVRRFLGEELRTDIIANAPVQTVRCTAELSIAVGFRGAACGPTGTLIQIRHFCANAIQIPDF